MHKCSCVAAILIYLPLRDSPPHFLILSDTCTELLRWSHDFRGSSEYRQAVNLRHIFKCMHNNGAVTVTTRASLSNTTIVMYDQPQFIQCPTSPLQFLQRTMVQSILHTFTTHSLSLSPQLIYKPMQGHELPHCSSAKAPKSPYLIHTPTPTYTQPQKCSTRSATSSSSASSPPASLLAATTR